MSPTTLLNILGYLNLILAGSMSLPLGVNWVYGEPHAKAFFISIALTGLSGLGLILLFKPSQRDLTHRDGFAIVGFSWISASFFGSLPYLFTGTLSSLTDAFFETASGFTTTGATVIADVETISLSILFWRALTQWLGGMGIVLLSVAILPFLGVGGMQLYRAEAPGISHDKLTPRMAQTARLLWVVYVAISGIQVLTLLLGGMNLYDSLCHTFTTMATGGFSTKNMSIEYFQNPFLEYAITFFMFLAGANFVLHYKFIQGEFLSHWRDEEFRFYASVLIASALLVSFNLMAHLGYDFFTSFRLALFQVTSIMTTTGYTSANYEKWPFFAQGWLLLLMFIGGCAGSTGGAIKCVRILLLIKHVIKELYRLIHPHAVAPVKLNGRIISLETLQAVWGMSFLYFCIFALASMAICLLGSDLLTSISAVAATLGNVGPGLEGVGPTDNYGFLSPLAKWILSACMLVGRLEIYTLTILLLPEFWKK
jgi:trk system potassium uptake protein TrkH